MSRFIETIRFEDGQFHLLDLHQTRVDRTFANFYPQKKPFDLASTLPSFKKSGKFKFRVEYDNVVREVSSSPYQKKVIESIKFVEAQVDYGFKYSDRADLDGLLLDSEADEIIIVQDGLVTDSTYSNLAFFDGEKWFTPRRPLLEGVRRRLQIDQGQITEMDIKPDLIQEFKKISFINAMMGLGELELSVSKIFW